mgnify:CR=1 FL=1
MKVTDSAQKIGFSRYQVIIHWLVACFVIFQIASGSTISNDFLALKEGKISIEDVAANSWYHLFFWLNNFSINDHKVNT